MSQIYCSNEPREFSIYLSPGFYSNDSLFPPYMPHHDPVYINIPPDHYLRYWPEGIEVLPRLRTRLVNWLVNWLAGRGWR